MEFHNKIYFLCYRDGEFNKDYDRKDTVKVGKKTKKHWEPKKIKYITIMPEPFLLLFAFKLVYASIFYI